MVRLREDYFISGMCPISIALRVLPMLSLYNTTAEFVMKIVTVLTGSLSMSRYIQIEHSYHQRTTDGWQ